MIPNLFLRSAVRRINSLITSSNSILKHRALCTNRSSRWVSLFWLIVLRGLKNRGKSGGAEPPLPGGWGGSVPPRHPTSDATATTRLEACRACWKALRDL